MAKVAPVWGRSEEAMSNSGRASISVIIPTHNRSKLLRRTLDALYKQTAPLLEVIVVSDGSTDSTRETVNEFGMRLPIKYLEQPQRGVSSARNLGLKHASADLVLLMDDDVIPSPQLIEAHLHFHEEVPELQSVLLGYVTWHPDLRVTPFMRWYGEYGGLFGFSRLKDNHRISPRFFYSCNISLKRQFLISQGGFTETLTVLEDNELGYRLAQNGMKLFFRSAALGYHYQTFTFEQSCQRLERYCSGLDPFLKTAAGRAMARRRRSLLFRGAENMVRLIAPFFSGSLSVIDSDKKLPNSIYRLLYWHYGVYLSFWSKADQSLLERKQILKQI